VLPHFQKVHDLKERDLKEHRDQPTRPSYFGRLSAEKGVDDLLRSMQKIAHMRLTIAGEGPQRAELQGLADSLRLSNVKFIGQVGREERDAAHRPIAVYGFAFARLRDSGKNDS